ncbi:hypothetical protein ACGFIU_25740 [Rhodococcus oryzae]|uniref:hypothetical protein n=1 Tax=Rhodococcus oryzae TaxID=2571143 RepID=UPI0037227631
MNLAVVAAGCSAAATGSLTSRWRNTLSHNMMRRGASILAAAAVVAGGLTVGAGTASAVCQMSGSLTQVDSIAKSPCLNISHWWVDATTADFTVTQGGPKTIATGEDARFFATIKNSGDPNRGMTKFVHHVPAGFVLKTVTGNSYRYIPAGNRYESVPVELTSEVDPVTGAVLVKPASGQPLSVVDQLYVNLTYEVQGVLAIGTSGITFEATGVPETRDWLATGTTTVTPIQDPIGSASGSTGS